MPLNTELRDLGLSGFTGANRIEGALGRFHELVRKGSIPEGSVLIVESLDRLDRRSVRLALPPFLELINAGITIITLIDKRIYNQEIVDADSMALHYSLLVFARANEESVTKSKRVNDTWEKKRLNAATAPMTARCPEWLKLIDGKFELINERVAIVVRIFEECVSGSGSDKLPHGATGRV